MKMKMARAKSRRLHFVAARCVPCENGSVKSFLFSLAVLPLLLAGCAGPASGPAGGASSSVSSLSALQDVTVTSPQPDAVVTSPLTVTGQARGTWFFEASFPVKLLDADGNVLAQAPAQAQGDWMTTNFVPFTVTLPFTPPAAKTGTLVLQKDNPSGLPEHEGSVEIPVKFP